MGYQIGSWIDVTTAGNSNNYPETLPRPRLQKNHEPTMRTTMLRIRRKSSLITITLLASCSIAAFVLAAPQDRGGPRFQDVLLHEQFDADENGQLDRAERDLARKEIASRPARGRRGGPPGMRGGQEAQTRPEADPKSLRIDRTDLKEVPRLTGTGLYDPDVLHTIFLDFAAPDWHDEMVAFHGTDIEVPAIISLDGKTVGEVGVSYRGNTSFDMPAKKSFGVSIDAFDHDLRIDGFRTLNLLNANGDPSVMREVLFSNIAAGYMPSPKANFVRVVVNDVYLGIYANVQQLNKDFTEEHYGSKKGVRWKVPPDFSGGAALTYHGDDIDDYRDRYELKTNSATDEDWADLIELCKVLRETPDDELEATLPRYLDIPETIRFLAIDNAFLDSDGYYSRGSDYYIYKAPDGAFHLLHYDNNETFGGGHGGGPGGRGGPGGPGGGRGGPPNFGPGGPGGGPPNFGPGGPGGAGGPGGSPPNFGPGGPGGGGGGGTGGASGAGGGRGGGAGGGSGGGAGGGRPSFGPTSTQNPGAQQDRRRNQDGRRGNRRGGRGGRGGPGGGQGGGMTQSPLAFENEIDTRPLITRILAVEAWRAEYLEVLRELATVELDWAILGARIDRYRDLIEREVVRDPFLGKREEFLKSLYGSDASLKSIAAERRKFLLNHDALKPPKPERQSGSKPAAGKKPADRPDA